MVDEIVDEPWPTQQEWDTMLAQLQDYYRHENRRD